ncbi:MAG: hypothetical protein WA851_09110 [Xanthobacteraceae bacterium]|jgi:hypothetical protein
MPLTTILVVSAIVLAFAAFAAVLAWSEHQTRHWRQSDQSAPEHESKVVKLPTASNSHREAKAA